MADQEEPTNEQLANFLFVYAKSDSRAKGLHLDASILEMMLERNPVFREAGLEIHRGFQEKANAVSEKMMRGALQCEHIRPNGKRCVNFNESGSFYCGLHKGEYEHDEGDARTEVAE